MEQWLREVHSTASHGASQETVGGEDGGSVFGVGDGEVDEDTVDELAIEVSNKF